MADIAVQKQLPIMVRGKPRIVWPMLPKLGLYQKKISGDGKLESRLRVTALSYTFAGNCLFASLSDQVYGTPAKHPEIRQIVVEYMRTNRIDFEGYVTADSVETRRPTRDRTTKARRNAVGDQFETYLNLMAASGSYGGQPELVAFCRACDRDVIIHRPMDQPQQFEKIENDRRAPGQLAKVINITYGDEETHAHYDSARKIINASPTNRKSLVSSIEGSCPYSRSDLHRIQALQRALPGIPPEEIHQFLEKGRKDLDASFQQLLCKERARSSSRSSSQRSSSSKRSLDEDSEPRCDSKRPDRRIHLRNRTIALVSSLDRGTEVSFRIRVDSPEPGTPASTQDTDSKESSPAAEPHGTRTLDDDYTDRDDTGDSSGSEFVNDQVAKTHSGK